MVDRIFPVKALISQEVRETGQIVDAQPVMNLWFSQISIHQQHFLPHLG